MGAAVKSRDSQAVRPLALSLCSDKRLARLTAGGNRAAFAAIYERYHEQIHRYCASIVRDPHDAADALQNAMLKLLNGMIDRGPPEELRPWLYRIAHNEAISIVRRRRTGDATLDASLAAEKAVARDDVRERLAELLRDIDQLPASQRGALLMHEVNGLPYSAVALALGSSPAAVKQSVYEARRALHEYAAGRGVECEVIRRKLSDHDRRALRGRKLGAHLRACDPCRRFEEAIDARRSELVALAPPLPPAGAAILLQKVLGASLAGGSGGGLAGTGASAGGVFGVAAAKPALVTVVAVGLGLAAPGMPIKDESADTPSAASPSAAAAATLGEQARVARGRPLKPSQPQRLSVRFRAAPGKPPQAGRLHAGRRESTTRAHKAPSSAAPLPPLPTPKAGVPPPRAADPPQQLAAATHLESLGRTVADSVTQVRQLTHSTVEDAAARLELPLSLARPRR